MSELHIKSKEKFIKYFKERSNLYDLSCEFNAIYLHNIEDKEYQISSKHWNNDNKIKIVNKGFKGDIKFLNIQLSNVEFVDIDLEFELCNIKNCEFNDCKISGDITKSSSNIIIKNCISKALSFRDVENIEIKNLKSIDSSYSLEFINCDNISICKADSFKSFIFKLSNQININNSKVKSSNDYPLIIEMCSNVNINNSKFKGEKTVKIKNVENVSINNSIGNFDFSETPSNVDISNSPGITLNNL